jgi:alanine dehydrogenase
VIVTAPYRYGQKPPVLLGEELSSLLEGLGRLIFVCDISIDQGGSTYLTSIATAPQHHGDAPIPFNKNLYHSFIANMPSIAGARASKELEQAVLPYLLKLFELRKKFKQDGVLSSALNFSGGHNVLEGLGADLKIPYTPLENIDYEDSQDLWTR